MQIAFIDSTAQLPRILSTMKPLFDFKILRWSVCSLPLPPSLSSPSPEICRQVLLSICSLLTDANPSDPLVANIAQQYIADRSEALRSVMWSLYSMRKSVILLDLARDRRNGLGFVP